MKKIHKILSQVPADYYDRGIRSNLLQRYWHNKKWKILKSFLGKTSGSLLDIGCADGTTTAQIKKFSPKLKITGVDYYKSAIVFANKNNPGIKFLHFDAHRLPFNKSSFDYVTAIEVLEHVHNTTKVVREIYRILKPGGFLIVGQDTDSLLFKAIWFFWSKQKGSVWKGSHISCMKPDDLNNLISSSGFKNKRQKFVNLKMEIFLKYQKI